MKRIIVIAALFSLGAKAQVKPDTTTRPASVHTSKVNPVPSSYGTDTKVNFVRIWEASKPYSSEANVMDTTRTVSEVKQKTQYYDGLGRSVQTVIKKISPAGKDLVAPILYDAFGREIFKYLPYVQITGNTSDGKFKTDPFNAQASYYTNGTYNPGNVGEQVFYNKTLFENSLLNRVDTLFAPGNSWGGSHIGVVKRDGSNIVSDSVRIWNISMTAGSSPTSSGKYPSGELYKSISIDEHGKKAIEYRDKEGQVILKKTQLAASPSTHHTGWLCTYYVYDDLGNLRFVIPPKATEAISADWIITTTIKDELCFRYEYDREKRLVIKKIPGAGEVSMVYDSRDRLVATQDANNQNNTIWIGNTYDQLNRPVGTYMITFDIDREGLQDAVSGDIELIHSLASSYLAEPLTETYYDDYTWVSGSGSGLSSSLITTYNSNTSYFYTASTSSPYPQSITASYLTWGMITGTKTKVLGTSTYLYSVNFYDDRARVNQIHSTNYSGGKDTTTMQYDFSGKVLRSLVGHAKSGTNSQRYIILTKYQYDYVGRITSINKKINNSPEVTVARNTYDELGTLKQKLLGQLKDENGAYTSTPAETLDYSYNIRGWLRGINKNYARGSGMNWFGMELCYDVGFNQDQLNGNIAGIRWQSNGSDKQRSYGFSYDPLGRLMKADFKEGAGSTWANSDGIDYSMKMGNGSDPTTAYDLNGNILKMWHMGLQINTSDEIDNLTYNYLTNSNKLAKVTDAQTADYKLGDFKDGSNSNDDYDYDVNGNLVLDQNKKISSIIYNHLNLPDSIRVFGKGTIKYFYDAIGNKQAKRTVDSTGSSVKTTITIYIGGVVYHNDTLQLIPHEEGRARLADPGNLNSLSYDYFIKDHLGNIRMVLTDEQKEDAYLCTMEQAYDQSEDLLFNNRVNLVEKPECFDEDPENQKVQKLGPAEEGAVIVGAGKVLKVMAGDVVSPKVFGWWDSNETGNNPTDTDPLEEIVSNLLAGGIINTGTKGGASNVTSGMLLSGVQQFLEGQNNYEGSGCGYLNWILLDDETFALIDGGQVPLVGLHDGDGCGQQKELLQIDEGAGIEIPRNGFLYIYVSNTNDTYPMYFDDLHITHKRSPLVEETHYYPFGLVMSGISSRAANTAENNRKWNAGSELASKNFSDGSGLELYETFYRSLDPQIGRFWQIDPRPNYSETPYASMGNNPISYNDPLGDSLLTKADHKRAARIEKRLNKTNRSLSKQATKLNKKIAAAEAKGNTTKADRLRGNLTNVNARIATNTNTLGNLNAIRDDQTQAYTFNQLPTGSTEGGVMLKTMSVNGSNQSVVVMSVLNDVNAVHELTHAVQGAIQHMFTFQLDNTANPILFQGATTFAAQQVNANAEIAAYQAQYAFSPSSMPSSTMGGVPRSMNNINAFYVGGINGSDAGGNGIPIYPHVRNMVNTIFNLLRITF